MIGTSTLEYAYIRTFIFFLHSIAPFSLLYCAAALTCLPRVYRLPKAAELCLAAEALFYAFFFLPHSRYLQHAASHPPLRSKEERRKLFNRVHSEVTDAERYICRWFKGATIEEIGRDDVKSYLTWAFFRSRLGGGRG